MVLSGFGLVLSAERTNRSNRCCASCSLNWSPSRGLGTAPMVKRSSTWDTSVSAFRPEIIAHGEVSYAYNLLQESFFNVLYAALSLERPEGFATQPEFYSYVLAIWHVLTNDSLQRKLAMTALESLPTTLDIKGGIERLQWARKQTDKLVEYRNLIVHTPITYWPRSEKTADAMSKNFLLVPKIGGVSTRSINLRRLRRIKSVRFWKALRNDFLNLNDYVDFVLRQIWHRDYERQNGASVVGASRAWPRRPKLPCVHRIEMIDRETKQATPIQSRPARRRPSRGRS